jgi:predicted phosphoribosyltransferase
MQRRRAMETSSVESREAQPRFADRADAGRQLARLLERYSGRSDTIVLALPRGGVPVAFEIAAALRAPLDVLTVRKLGLPHRPELAMGAIASGGVCVLNDRLIEAYAVSEDVLAKVARREAREIVRREREYRGRGPAPELRERVVILVDDGLATGATMRAAVLAVRERHPASIVVAVPVAPQETCSQLRGVADEVVCAVVPSPFRAVGLWYEDFEQVTDAQVRGLLRQAARR